MTLMTLDITLRISPGELHELKQMLAKRKFSEHVLLKQVLHRMDDPWVSARALEILVAERSVAETRIRALERLIEGISNCAEV